MEASCLATLLKTSIGQALMPLSLVLIGLALSVLLASTRRLEKCGRWLAALTLMFFLLVTNEWFSRRLIGGLENAYPPIPDYSRTEELPSALRACKAIVVLGSGNGITPDRAATDALNSSALARLTAAVRLARLLPEARIIFSGSTPDDVRPHAQVMREAAISLGVTPDRISLIEGVRDTDDEAHELTVRLAGQPFVLITSAWHLPRAVGLCRKSGLQPIPAPTDFLASAPNRKGTDSWDWTVESLQRSTCAFHEGIGLLWTRLRGQR
jgi:uncharacterized SAM-binding protein YcdF (DUF218 family)